MTELDLFDYKGDKFNTNPIIDHTKDICNILKTMNDIDKIECLNEVRKMLHSESPLKLEPVDCVLWIKSDNVHANDYNPNSVAPPEMELLHTSISADGYTQPIVTFPNNEAYEVVDGFHRHRVGKEYKDISDRVHGYLPVVAINESQEDKGDRIASTIRHNRARGKHQITAMSDIILDLRKRNWSDEKISHNLGMQPDEVLRLAQISGLAEMFKDREFSKAWEAETTEDNA
jgi:ParB-like chromosome segregation protein Spo0J